MDYDLEVPYQPIFANGGKIVGKKEQRVECILNVVLGIQIFSCIAALIFAVISPGPFGDHFLGLLVEIMATLTLGNALYGDKYRKGCLNVYLYLFSMGTALFGGLAFLDLIVNFSRHRESIVEHGNKVEEQHTALMVVTIFFTLGVTVYNALVAWSVYLYKKLKF